eukprot:CAMPEP_0119336692 /NCGR_PEP_ID=MMETSP1333-20130426/92364_1 /TAXON_ID=418940 /ORGANISM="Scyphosphaera apsteinii, Strain RCC1455" /LENGTH=39 /DNA_ID= /DNA_START= /DNA_END= /DNA_ORIENTATION=
MGAVPSNTKTISVKCHIIGVLGSRMESATETLVNKAMRR